MRPKKIRWVKCDPTERCFTPQKKPHISGCCGIVLTLDEFEAVRLLDYQGLSQTEASARMHIHRSTVSRIITLARQKISQALVEIKSLRIEGGCCKVIKRR